MKGPKGRKILTLLPLIISLLVSTLIFQGVKAQEEEIFTCFGVASDSQTVCHGHGTCTALDTCVCDQGWNGTQCQTCTQYDECGICGGDGSSCAVIDQGDSAQTSSNSTLIQMTSFEVTQIPESELTQEEKEVSLVHLSLRLNVTAPIYANVLVVFNCIDGEAASELSLMWSVSNVTSEEFVTYSYEQRTTVTEMYNCFGNKYETLLDLGGAHNDITKSYLGGALTITAENTLNDTISTVSPSNDFQNSTEIYSQPIYFVISTSATGRTLVEYSTNGLGFTVSNIHQVFLAVGEMKIVIRTCLNKPSGYDVALLHDTISTSPSGNSQSPVTFNYVTGSTVCTMLNGKCCQFWRYETSDASEVDIISSVVSLKWQIQSLDPQLDGKFVESAITINAQRSPNIMEQETVSNFNLTVSLFADDQYSLSSSTFTHGKRVYCLANLTPISPSRCNLFTLEIQMVKQCVRSADSSSSSVNEEDIPPVSCDSNDVDSYIIYDAETDSKPAVWAYEQSVFPPNPQSPPCDTTLYMNWIARMLKTRSKSTTYLVEITWKYGYNDYFDHSNNGNPGPSHGLISPLKKTLKSKTLKTKHHLAKSFFHGDQERRNLVSNTVTCPEGTIYDVIQQDCVQPRRSMTLHIFLGLFFFLLVLIVFVTILRCGLLADPGKVSRKKNQKKSTFY